MTFTVNRADIGTTNALNFYVYTADGGEDYAPDSAVNGARASYSVVVGGPGTTNPPPPPPPPPPRPRSRRRRRGPRPRSSASSRSAPPRR
jgi:hypothetical protein